MTWNGMEWEWNEYAMEGIRDLAGVIYSLLCIWVTGWQHPLGLRSGVIRLNTRFPKFQFFLFLSFSHITSFYDLFPFQDRLSVL